MCHTFSWFFFLFIYIALQGILPDEGTPGIGFGLVLAFPTSYALVILGSPYICAVKRLCRWSIFLLLSQYTFFLSATIVFTKILTPGGFYSVAMPEILETPELYIVPLCVLLVMYLLYYMYKNKVYKGIVGIVGSYLCTAFLFALLVATDIIYDYCGYLAYVEAMRTPLLLALHVVFSTTVVLLPYFIWDILDMKSGKDLKLGKRLFDIYT